MSVIANVAINVDSRNAVSKLREVQSQSQLTERAVQGLTSAFASLTAAFGAGFAISKVVQDVKELDTNLRRLGTVGGDVAALDKGLGRLSRNLDGVASKAELAAASYQALSAGFTETGANLRLVEAATKAAVGGLVDVTSVVEVTTKTLNAYGMSGSRAAEVTDSISKAIEFGQVQWSDYTSQLGRVASIAAIAGVSLDEVNAFIAAATKNGATAEIAFTGLGATLNTLLQPTKESQEAAAALGIEWNLAGLNAKGFDGLLAELAKKQDTNKEAAARLLGSQEAMRGVFAANAKAGKDFQMILEGLQGAAGKTESDFNQMKDTLENQLKALDTAFKNLSEALGVVFGPAAIDAIGGVTDAVNGFADIIKTIPEPVGKGALEIGKLVAQVILLQKAIQGIIALRLALIGMLTATATSAGTAAAATSGLTMNMRYLQGSMVQANAAASPLLATLRTIAAFGVITVGINLIVTGLQEALTAAAEVRRLRGERAAGGAAAIYGGSATADQKAAAKQTLAAVRKEQQRYRDPGTVAAQTLLGPLAPVFGVPTTAQAGRRRPVLQERARRAEAVLGLPTRAAAAAAQVLPPTPQQPTADGGDGAGRKKGKSEAEKAAEKAAREEAQLQSRLRGLQIETQGTLQLALIKGKIAEAEMAGNKELAIRLQGEQRNQQILIDLQRSMEGVTDEREQQALLAKAQADLESAGMDTAAEMERLMQDRTKSVQDVISGLEFEKAKMLAATDVQKQAIQFLEIENQLKSQGITLSDEQVAAIRRIIAETANLTKAQQEAQAKLQMEKDLYQGIADTVVGGFSSAIDAAVKGTESLGEALKGLGADLLQTIGKMLIMYGIAQALGALGGSDGVGVFSFLAKGFGFKAAKDGAYWPGGFEAFADGGVVNRPTMGLIGEGGEPEYVIPASKMRGAMARYSNGARGDAVIPSSGAEPAAGGGGAAVAAPIDVRYTVERINSVDYVTADQFQRGMAQAASQGAKQGEQLAMRRLQQSASTRSRLGI